MNNEQCLTENDEMKTQLSEMTDDALDDLISAGSEGSLGAWDDA